MNCKNDQCSGCQMRDLGIFCDLSESALNDLSEHKVSNIYKKGQTLFMQGNPPFGMYCISSGIVKITQVGSDGKESIVRLAKPGDTVGHRSLFSEQSYKATATAVQETKVCFYDKKYIQKLVKEQPTIAYNIISRLGRDLGAAEQKLTSFSQKNVRERLAELLLILKEGYGEKVDGRIKLNIKLTREEMASMIGTASETLIRFFTELKNEGLIEQEGKIIFILDEEKLLDFANIPS
ncbi:MAG: Crp/Fnr family transcriptional regulator [Halobacteriovoraceae bacterium]|jgi:CRP-like cAMP-binding protein|nr:Crp/Fnr family transcriptional regulator [Halobacteriovoraceae bacterium]